MGNLTKILAVMLSVTVSFAADMTTGYTFTSGEQVTHTKLNNLVNNAVIGPAFLTGKTAATNAAASDLLLLYSAADAALRKITVGNLISYESLITGRDEDTAPTAGDFLLTYDTTSAALKKATLDNSVFFNDSLVNGKTNLATPSLEAAFLAYDGGYYKVARSNLFGGAVPFLALTNVAAHTAPTNTDQLLITTTDGTNYTNKRITLRSVVEDLPTATNATWLPVIGADGIGKIQPINMLIQMIPAGMQIGFTNNSDATMRDVTAQVPFDTSKPQSSEMTEVLAIKYTPSYTNSLLVIRVSVPVDSQNTEGVVGLFRDPLPDALAVTFENSANGYSQTSTIEHVLTAGTTGEITFSVRVGRLQASGAVTVNGDSGTSVFGGTLKSTISVAEIKQ